MGRQLVTLALGLTLLGLASPVASIYSSSKDDLAYEDYEDAVEAGETEVEVMTAPSFVSVSQRVEVNLGDTVRLPCIVDRLEGFVMLWKRQDEILSVASQIIDQRVRLEEEENGNYLIISQASPRDSGVYTCQLSAYRPTELHHTLTVRVPPEIETQPTEELVTRAGQGAELECRATAGTPTPRLTWSKEGAHATEDLSADVTCGQGGQVCTLRLTSVTRHTGGRYICAADNGGEAVTRPVRLHVEFAPEIHVDRSVIVTSLGAEEEISCNVHAYPKPSVTWMKEDKVLDKTDGGLLMSSQHHRHSLVLLSMDNSTVGRYYCVASNERGQATKSILVTGLASNIRVTSDRFSQLDTEYLLQWEVETESDVSEWVILVRRDKALLDTWDSLSLDNRQPLEAGAVRASHSLTGLSQARLYRVKIGARNEFGWNYSEEEFVFGTKGADAVYKAAMTAGSSVTVSVSVSVISVTMLVSKLIFV